MFFEHCPFDYCNTETFSVYNPDGQCDNNRSGILCGDCIQGYSLILGSNNCMNCTNQFWQLPIILLGSALAGIVLVAVLIVLNLTVSVGTINGLLFFVNVVKVYGSILFHYNHSEALQYLFSWLNLDLGITTCFYEGMDACQKVGLHFVFPVYLLILVMVIVAVCRCGQWIGLRSLPWVVKLSDKTAKLMGAKIIPVLATLLLFSYTKLIRTISLIYNIADIKVFECNTSDPECVNSSRWYVNGSVKCLEGCHATLFGLGIGLAIPIISFTLFLLFFPLLERYVPQSHFWSSCHMRLKPWYDAYGGPYKDEYRFWTGLLLLVRCLLALVMAVSNDPNVDLSFLMWVCLALIPMVALLQVYKSVILNVLEIIYLSIILAMVFLSTCQNNIQVYLVLSISVCLLIAILMFHTYQRVRSTRLAVFVKKSITDIEKNLMGKELIRSGSKNKVGDKTRVPATSASSVSPIHLREPLIEYMTI